MNRPAGAPALGGLCCRALRQRDAKECRRTGGVADRSAHAVVAGRRKNDSSDWRPILQVGALQQLVRTAGIRRLKFDRERCRRSAELENFERDLRSDDFQAAWRTDKLPCIGLTILREGTLGSVDFILSAGRALKRYEFNGIGSRGQVAQD